MVAGPAAAAGGGDRAGRGSASRPEFTANRRLGYRRLVERVREAVATRPFPPGASVLVVSRGDRELVELDGRDGRHFPQDPTGATSATIPRDSDEAVARLEAAARRPAPSTWSCPRPPSWWLEHYAGFAESPARPLPGDRAGGLHDLPARLGGRRPRPPARWRDERQRAGSERPSTRIWSRGSRRPWPLRCPPGASVLVVSKGDESLLALPGRDRGCTFPQDGAGGYAGHHPRDGAAGDRRARGSCARAGAEYLVLPATARWWLELLRRASRCTWPAHGELVADLPDTCLIYGLGSAWRAAPGVPAIERAAGLARADPRLPARA